MPKILDLIMDFSMPTTSIFNIDDLDIEKNFRYFFYLVANRKKILDYKFSFTRVNIKLSLKIIMSIMVINL